MNEKRAELVSALLDDELDGSVRQKIISDITGPEREELERFERYCLIGDAIRGESSVLAVSIAGRVHESLADEPVVLAPQRRTQRPWLKPVAGIAVAASVAVVAILAAPGLMTQQGGNVEPLQLAADTGRQATAGKPVLVAAGTDKSPLPVAQSPATARWQGLTPELEERLNRLVIEHHEFGGRTGINGPVPHIGLVSYGSR